MLAISTDRRDDVVVAHMVHGKANVLDVEFCREIISVLDTLAASDARAVVLTGQGNIFSAGVDLIRFQQAGPDYRDLFVPAISQLVVAMLRFPKPLIAAVNGHAVAGGCVMACTADHRVMARGTGRIGVPEVIVGLPYPVAALEAVRFAVPPQQLHAVVYGGATYLPEDALAVGLVDDLVDAVVLVDAALEAAARLATIPTEVFAHVKRALRAPVFANIAAGAEQDREITAVWKTSATLERVRDYVERTFKARDR